MRQDEERYVFVIDTVQSGWKDDIIITEMALKCLKRGYGIPF